MTSAFAGVRGCVFDAYGTLLDVNAAARSCRADLGERWEELAALWRAKQLEYTWLRSLMGRYADFWQVTGEALDYALERHGLSDPALRSRLIELYLRLEAYSDAEATLAGLRGRGLRTAILSNGSPTMLSAAVDHARLAPLLDEVLSVDSLGVYKPHPSVYQFACDRLGLPAGEILFVSANGWDAGGAAAFGFRVAWLNRAGLPDERLPAGPAAVVDSLSALLPLVAA
ncbi:haloacid dehalogenase type II [Azospirillum sp. sgz302134]